MPGHIETPLEIKTNDRHGDESEIARRARRPLWIGVLATALVVLAVFFLLARTGVGPGPQSQQAPPSAIPQETQKAGLPAVNLPQANEPPGPQPLGK